jgi:hypothetical protein
MDCRRILTLLLFALALFVPSVVSAAIFVRTNCDAVSGPTTSDVCYDIAQEQWQRFDGVSWVSITGANDHGLLDADSLDDDDHLIYVRATDSAGAPAAGSCLRNNHILTDTTGEEPYFCSDGVGGNPRKFSLLGNKYDQFSDGTNAASATGNETFLFEDSADLDFTVTAGATDKVTGIVKNDAITFAKIQNITDARLLGRSAGSAGDTQEITVGSGLTLSGGALTSTAGGGTFVRKTASQIRNASATDPPGNDTHLLINIPANETWEVKFVIHYSSSAVADVRTDFSYPTGAAGRIGLRSGDAGGGSTTSTIITGTDSVNMVLNGSGSQDMAIIYVLIRNGGTAGDLQFRWSQNTSEATNTTVFEDSYLVAIKR